MNCVFIFPENKMVSNITISSCEINGGEITTVDFIAKGLTPFLKNKLQFCIFSLNLNTFTRLISDTWRHYYLKIIGVQLSQII